MFNELVGPLERHWRVALALGLGLGWMLTGPLAGVSSLPVPPEAYRALPLLTFTGSLLGCILGGTLWSRFPAAAVSGGRLSLAAAGLLSASLHLLPAEYTAAATLLSACLHTTWMVVLGSNFFQQVAPAERGRVAGWTSLFVYVPLQGSIWLSLVLPPHWVRAVLVLVLVLPILWTRPITPHTPPGEENLLPSRWWWRLVLFILLSFVLGGQVRTMGALPGQSAHVVTQHLELLYQTPTVLLAGLLLDRKFRGGVATFALLAMGVGYGLRFALPEFAGALALHAGTRIGFALLDVFWWYQMARMAEQIGPIFAFAGGSVINLVGLIIGTLLTPLVPPPVLGGMAVVMVFASQMLVSQLRDRDQYPDPGPEPAVAAVRAAAPAAPVAEEPPVDLVAILAEAIPNRLTPRETDVARLLLDGLSTSEIAAALFVTENTVRTHLKNLYRKAGCSSRQELMSRLLERVAAK